MGDGIVERLTELEGAVKRAAESLARIREENAQLKREVKRLGDERRQVLAQVDMILKDIGKLDPALSLAALDIADELFRSREEKKTDEDDVGARLGALVALLDKVAPPDPGSDR